jgi:hypothetical protein
MWSLYRRAAGLATKERVLGIEKEKKREEEGEDGWD